MAPIAVAVAVVGIGEHLDGLLVLLGGLGE